MICCAWEYNNINYFSLTENPGSKFLRGIIDYSFKKKYNISNTGREGKSFIELRF